MTTQLPAAVAGPASATNRQAVRRLLACTVLATTAFASAQPLLTATARMGVARAAHTATGLADGRVLIAGGMDEGGESGAGATTEIYDAKTGRFSDGPLMHDGRQSHTATLLGDGRVLIAGGYGPDDSYLATAELYDPRSGRFTRTGSMRSGRAGHAATLLSDGRVLIAGGVGPGWTFLASAEVYDPKTAAFTPTGAMSVARESHTATLLGDGTVLVTGGHSGRHAAIVIYSSAERYDSRANGGRGAFRPAGSMAVRRHKHGALRLADGRVLVTAGADERDDRGQYRSTELFDPATGRFAPGPDMVGTHYKHAAASLLLPDGTVFIGGGNAAPEWYDPRANRFRTVAAARGTPPLRGSFSAVAPLPDGGALVTGGYGNGSKATNGAWVLAGTHIGR